MQHLQISLHPVVLLAYFWPFRPFQTQLLAQSPVVSFDMYGMCVDVHKQSRRLLNVTNVSHGFTWMWTLTSISYPHYILWYEGAKTISVCVCKRMLGYSKMGPRYLSCPCVHIQYLPFKGLLPLWSLQHCKNVLVTWVMKLVKGLRGVS